MDGDRDGDTDAGTCVDMLGDGVGDGGRIDRDGLGNATKDGVVGRVLSVVWASACPGSRLSGIQGRPQNLHFVRPQKIKHANHANTI
jgi:hypothetical protein